MTQKEPVFVQCHKTTKPLFCWICFYNSPAYPLSLKWWKEQANFYYFISSPSVGNADRI